MAAENKEMEEMTQRAVRRKGGAQSEPDGSPAEPPASQPPPEESPLDFAKSVYRDASQPMVLRASMARAALPYTLARVQPSERSDEDARETGARKTYWPFDRPDPYGSIRPDWRAVLEKAGLIPSEEQWRAAFMAQGNHPLPVPPRDAQADDALRAARSERDAAQELAEAIEVRALAAEAALAQMREDQAAARAAHGATAPVDVTQESDAPAQLAALREKLRAAEEKARDMEARWRRAQMLAQDMEQRALSTEAILQRGR